MKLNPSSSVTANLDNPICCSPTLSVYLDTLHSATDFRITYNVSSNDNSRTITTVGRENDTDTLIMDFFKYFQNVTLHQVIYQVEYQS